jgi:hypothetical protein
MFKKLVVCALLALGAASAASYSVKLSQPSIVKGTQLKPGDYRLTVDSDKVTFVNGQQKVETSAKVETADKKFDNTSIRYDGTGLISEIRIGGTKTKLVFSN